MMISTIPITTPLMVQAGYDPVWYGILLVLLIQTAMISPPFGINLFVIHGIRGRGTLSDVEKGSAPFVIALLAMIAMICVWPDIVMVAVRCFGSGAELEGNPDIAGAVTLGMGARRHDAGRIVF